MARRPLAASIVVAAAALGLAGCIAAPPASPPAAPTVDTAPLPDSSAPATEPTQAPAEDATESAPEAGVYDHLVDDTVGDTWAFTVTGVETNPPMTTGAAEPGTQLVAVLIDGTHVAGNAGFTTCFDVLVTGTDGQEYAWSDTIALTAENDIFYASDQFTGARALVQLPEGVSPQQVTVRSTFGASHGVADVVIPVQ